MDDVRPISMERSEYLQHTCDEHQLILKAIHDRNAQAAIDCMSAHVTLPQEQLVEVVTEGMARL